MRGSAEIQTARSAAFAALRADGPLAGRVDNLQGAADLVRAIPAADDEGTTAQAWRAYSAALLALAHFGRWDAATIAAQPEADRYLRAAHRGAEIALDLIDPHHPACQVIAAALQQIATSTSLSDADTAAACLSKAPLVTPLIAPETRTSHPPITDISAPTPEARAVCLVSFDDGPLVAPAVVRPGVVHSFTLTARVLDWPEDMPELILRPVTVWPGTAVQATEVRAPRPTDAQHGIREVAGVTRVVLHATDPIGEPLSFMITAELIGEQQQKIPVLGYETFAVRAYDPTLDVVTGVEVLDGRLRDIFATIRGKVPADELSAFARLMSATCRAAVRIQADNVFGKGTKVPEDHFQDQMQARLGMASELQGRLHRRHQAGGITDLIHDDIVLELKVEKGTPVTIERASHYVGQPVQYATGGGRQLSLLCILDMSTKAAPLGILANSVYLLEPETHPGDAEHPSWVGVIVIGGNLPVPSDWSGKSIPTRMPAS